MVSAARLAANRLSLAVAIGAGIILPGSGGGVVASLTSGSSRARINTLFSTVSTSTTFVTNRTYHEAAVAGTEAQMDIWNGYATNGGASNPENPAANQITVAGKFRAAFVTNISGFGLDQSGGTLTPVTFFDMLKDADFVAAGGAVSSDGFTVTIPPNFVARCDKGPAIPKGGFFVHIEDNRASGAIRPIMTRGVSEVGDAVRSASAQNENVNTLNWTQGAVTTGSVLGPIAILMKPANSNVKTVVIDGDSIIAENNDRAGYRGILAFVARALHAAGYPFFNVAIPGSTMGDMVANPGNYKIRRRYHQFCDAVLTNHGNNDRGSSGVDTLLTRIRAHGTFMRSLAKPGARLIRCTWFPRTSSTDNWQTVANQTVNDADAMVPGTQGTIADWMMRRGAYAGIPFVPANGEPDAAFDAYAAVGGTSDGKWPVTGWAGGTLAQTFASGVTSIQINASSPPTAGDTLAVLSAGTNRALLIRSVSGSGPYTVTLDPATPTTSASNAAGDAVVTSRTPDGTHPVADRHIAAANALQPQLPTLLGFSTVA